LTPALSAYHAASLFLYRLSIVQGKLIDLTPSEWFVKIFLSFMNSCNTHLSMYRLILSMQEFAAFLYPLPQEVPIVSFHTEASITPVTDKDADIQGILITMSNDLTQHMYLFNYNLLLLKLEYNCFLIRSIVLVCTCCWLKKIKYLLFIRLY